MLTVNVNKGGRGVQYDDKNETAGPQDVLIHVGDTPMELRIGRRGTASLEKLKTITRQLVAN